MNCNRTAQSRCRCVKENTFGNRNNVSRNLEDFETTSSNYSICDGFVDGDLIYVPYGMLFNTSLRLKSVDGSIITLASFAYPVPLLIRLTNMG